MVTLIIHSVLNDNIWIHLIFVVLLWIIPDYIWFGGVGSKFLYPFFILTYLLHKFDFDIIWFIRKNIILFLFAYPVLYCLFNYNTYIYISGFSIWNKFDAMASIGYACVRFLIGSVGTALLVFFVYSTYKDNFLNKVLAQIIGRETIGIYILSSKLISGVLFTLFLEERVNYFYDVILTCGVIFICHWIIFIIKKVPKLNMLLLGGI